MKVELREGFELTSRMLFNSLNKYKIVEYEPKTGDKLDKGKMKVVGELKVGEGEEQKKGTVGKVVEKGWEAEGKIIRVAEVVVFI